MNHGAVHSETPESVLPENATTEPSAQTPSAQTDQHRTASEAPYRPALLRPLFERRIWSETSFLLLSLPIGVAGVIWLVSTLLLGLGTSITLVGLPIVAVSLAGARRLGATTRSAARSLLDLSIAEPPPLVHEPGFVGWVKASLLDPVGWRTQFYLLLSFPLGLIGFLVAVFLWLPSFAFVPLLIATPWVVRGLAIVNRVLVRELLAPVPLSDRVRRLQHSRDQAVDTAASDLRRIERNLHDGAQARLVALAMDLGMAKEQLTQSSDPQQATQLVTDAHDEAKRALGELRDLVRGIHPAVLTDRGLDAALSSLVSHCTVPVSLTVDPSMPCARRPRPAIEAIAYFAASELLVNVSKHSGAASVWVQLRRDADFLVLEMRDDGIGGADPLRGTGLAGLSERVESVEGWLMLDSPPGGPTTVRVELPCGS